MARHALCSRAPHLIHKLVHGLMHQGVSVQLHGARWPASMHAWCFMMAQGSRTHSLALLAQAPTRHLQLQLPAASWA